MYVKYTSHSITKAYDIRWNSVAAGYSMQRNPERTAKNTPRDRLPPCRLQIWCDNSTIDTNCTIFILTFKRIRSVLRLARPFSQKRRSVCEPLARGRCLHPGRFNVLSDYTYIRKYSFARLDSGVRKELVQSAPAFCGGLAHQLLAGPITLGFDMTLVVPGYLTTTPNSTNRNTSEIGDFPDPYSDRMPVCLSDYCLHLQPVYVLARTYTLIWIHSALIFRWRFLGLAGSQCSCLSTEVCSLPLFLTPCCNVGHMSQEQRMSLYL